MRPTNIMIPNDARSQATFDAAGAWLARVQRSTPALRSWVFAGVAFASLCIAAQVRVPVLGSPVPMTLQSFVVLLIGLSLSARIAFGTTLAYAVAGTVGLPILANPAGLLGMTGGYLVGFALAAPLMAVLRGCRAASYVRCLFAAFVGLFVILALGVIWQYLGFGGSWSVALGVGFLPFVGKSAIEALLAVALVRAGRSWFVGRSASRQ